MTNAASVSTSLLRQEYDRWHELLHVQPLATQRFLAAQAQRLGDALTQGASAVRFALPDQVLVTDSETGPSVVPVKYRDQLIGRSGLLGHLSRADLRRAAVRRLQDLELLNNREVSCAAKLLRHATALYLIHELLPAGDDVKFDFDVATDTPNEAQTETVSERECEVAQHFYLPQLAAIDEHDRLLVKSVPEAEAQLAAMRRYLDVLDLAQTLALYIVTDDQYRRKHFGILKQLVDQGRALARHETKAMILDIKNMAAQHELDQGVHLTMPYFDDQTLGLCSREFDVTPVGRVMFVPTFVVKAARQEQIAVLADLRLSATTRQHLLHELRLLEHAFDDGSTEEYRAWQQLYEQQPTLFASELRIAAK